VKFTETGTVSIEASIESVSEERLAVLFEVADTGMGIPEDKQKQLFQAFSQADYSTTRKYGGTGLGLSISKNLVELMGGEIGVRSVPGKGSTFWFRIPFPRLSADQRHDPLGEYAGSLTGLRMVVYDPLVPHSAPARYLRAAGAEVITPASHTEVIARLHSETGVGRSVDAAVVCLRIGDSYAARLIDDIRRIAPDVKIIVVAPHLSGSAAKVVTAHKTIASIPAPIRRTRFYATVASATGRATQLQVNASGGGSWNFEAPTTHEALAHGCLILVAEDNQTNQFVIKSQMRKLGFAAEFVNDGKEAWDTLNRHAKRYGLLITDCHMPFIDGYQLTGFIRDHELKFGGHLPVVALTANALQGEADVCRAAGMDGYLFKPTDLATLETTILKWLPQAASLRRPLDAPPAQLAVGEGPPEDGALSTAAIDTSVLAGLLGSSDPAALREMLSLYLETELETPATFRALVEAKDGLGLAKAAHAAKGAASSAGAMRLMELCRDIERDAAQDDWPHMSHLCAQVDGAFADVRSFIERF